MLVKSQLCWPWWGKVYSEHKQTPSVSASVDHKAAAALNRNQQHKHQFCNLIPTHAWSDIKISERSLNHCEFILFEFVSNYYSLMWTMVWKVQLKLNEMFICFLFFFWYGCWYGMVVSPLAVIRLRYWYDPLVCTLHGLHHLSVKIRGCLTFTTSSPQNKESKFPQIKNKT